MLGKRKESGIDEIGNVLKPHQEAVCHDSAVTFLLHVHKKLKVGAKPAIVVPIYTKCCLSEERFDHPRGYTLPLVMGAYCHMAGRMDHCGVVALGLRHKSPQHVVTGSRIICPQV